MNETTRTPLEGWKEIAAYLQRDVRTVSRWEKSERLPVRRHRHGERSSVYAHPDELDAWREARAPEQPQPRTPWLWGLAAAAAVAGALLVAGPILNPPDPLADAAARSRATVARLVWSADHQDEVDDSGGPSPDGRLLSYVDWNRGSLDVRDLETGESRTLVPGDDWESGFVMSSAYHPDGREIAYVWWDYSDSAKQHVDLRVLALNEDGSPAETRTAVAFNNRGSLGAKGIEISGWTPDGEQVLLVAADEDLVQRIVFVAVADGKATPLKTLGWEAPKVVLSPDGSWVAYDEPSEPGSAQRDIYVVAADGTSESKIVSHPADDGLVAWTPDSSALLFTSDRGGSFSLYALPLHDGDAAGEPALVKSSSGRMRGVGALVGGRLLYSLESKLQQVRLGDLETLGDRNAIPEPLETRYAGKQSAPVYSPDGRYLAYFVVRGRDQNQGRVVVRNLESGEEISFGRETGVALWAAYYPTRFSPDSRRLLILARDSRGRYRTAIIDLESRETRLLAPDEKFHTPLDWLDQTTILERGMIAARRVQSNKEHSEHGIVAIDLESGERRQILAQSRFIDSARMSPDGKRLAVTQRFEDDQQRERGRIRIIDPANGDVQMSVELPEDVSATQSAIDWRPDGKWIYLAASRERLLRIRVADGEVEDTGLRLEGLRSLAIHPDGRRIAIGAGVSRVEIWALENFLPQRE